jgi:AAA family ATPase
MASISSRRFTVESDQTAEHTFRAARRLIFNADALKSTKLCTGDIVAISNGDKAAPGKVGLIVTTVTP